MTTQPKFKSIAGGLLAAVVIAVALVAAFWNSLVPVVATGVNIVRHWGAATGTLVIERSAGPAQVIVASSAPVASSANADWPSYNRTLTSERDSSLAQINSNTVQQLSVLCSYDTGECTSFQTEPIAVEGALIGTTEHAIFSLDPAPWPRTRLIVSSMATKRPSDQAGRTHPEKTLLYALVVRCAPRSPPALSR